MPSICAHPHAIEARAISDKKSAYETGDVFKVFNKDKGLVCQNSDQVRKNIEIKIEQLPRLMDNATITRFDICVPQRSTWKTTSTNSRTLTSTPSTSTGWKQVTPPQPWRASCAMIMTSVVMRILRYYAECPAESKISSRRNFHSKIIRFHCVNIIILLGGKSLQNEKNIIRPK